jgi:hypothetical protein
MSEPPKEELQAPESTLQSGASTPTKEDTPGEYTYITGARLATLVFALCLSTFCVALDNTVSIILHGISPI